MEREKFMPKFIDKKEEEPEKTETESEQKELLEIDLGKLSQQEKGFLGKFRGKAGDIAKVLVLVTVLSAAPGFVRNIYAQAEGSPKIEQTEKEKQLKKKFYSLEFQKNIESQSEIAEKINLIYLSVINNGEAKPIILSSEELRKNPTLDIDGYIANIMIFDKEEMDISLNQNEAKKIGKLKGEDYIDLNGGAVYPDELETEEYGKEIFQQLIDREVSKDKKGRSFLRGGYFFGRSTRSLYSGKPINNLENNTLTFKIDDKIYTIPIKQKVSQEFRKINLDSERQRDDLVFNYLGNDRDRFLGIEEMDEKLQAIAEATNNVESISDMDIVDRVYLIDYKANNAFADAKEKFITFLSGYLEKNSVEDVKIVTEHEILHKYVFEKGFTEDPQVREIFANLKGYTGDKKQRIIEQGFIPFDDFNENYKNKEFFAFVNEKDFLGKGGGHSHGNIWEFCTSFTHSLMYLDRLENNLEKFSGEEKSTILDNYIVVLKTMIKYDNQKDEFLKDKLKHLEEIKEKISQ